MECSDKAYDDIKFMISMEFLQKKNLKYIRKRQTFHPTFNISNSFS